MDLVSSASWLHPAQLQALGAAYGLAAPPPAASRVLCLGTHPNAGYAAELAAELPGIQCVAMPATGVLEPAPRAEPFDYVLLPEGYAALNRTTQRVLLAALAERMAPHGLLAVAYPTVVGSQILAMIWEPLRQYAARFADPQAQLAAARELLATLAAHLPCRPERSDRRDVYALVLRAAHAQYAHLDNAAFLRCLNAEPPPALAVHDCVAAAAHAGLRYLGEIEPADACSDARNALEATLTPAVLDGRPEAEPWRDLIRGRLYRRSAFCHAAVPILPAHAPCAPHAIGAGSRLGGLPEGAVRRSLP